LRHSRFKRPPAVAIAPRKRPQQQRSQATVDALMTAAAQVLVRDGYDKATTGLIAAQAGVSIGTVYQYYPNKDAIFSELLQRELDEVAAAMAEAASKAADGSLREHVRAAVGALFAVKAKNPMLHRALKTQLGRLEGDRMVKELNRRALEVTEMSLRMHGDAVRFADPARAAFLVVNAVEGIVYATLANAPATLKDPTVADEIADMIVAFLESSRTSQSAGEEPRGRREQCRPISKET
jgi:AcrR family transcriptional regulator